ncbi:MAG: phosphatase domain-containing protein [Bdellovibrionota bacterium]
MKTLLTLALLFSFNSFAGITVISDLDDTIKITDAGNLGNATFNGVFTEKVFTGMPEFLKMARKYSDALHVVSAGPKLIKTRVSSLLKKHQIQHEGIHMRAIPGKEGKLEFKVRIILDIMSKTENDIILMGDDVDLDPEVYTEVMNKHPERILGAYIHTVKNREISEKFTRYYTSLDLALQENIAGRLDNDSVSAVIEPMLKETKLSRIIPKFADCPTTSVVWEWQVSTMFSAEALEITRKLNEFCLRGK